MIFDHDNAGKVHVSFATPSVLDIYIFMEQMMLDPCRCQEFEEATQAQADSKLWLPVYNGQLTSSCLGEILHR